MRRSILRGAVAVAVLSLLLGGSVVAAQQDQQRVTIVDGDGESYDVALPFTVSERPSSSTSMPPTTTTEPPTTSTTEPPTTTSPPTTTTQPPTIPPPIDCRAEGIERYDITIHDAAVGGILWTAPYCRTLPYTAGVGWLDGDRSGYRCAYGPLERDGVLVGRFWTARIPNDTESVYVAVKDEKMREGVRYFDGVLATGGGQEIGDCPTPSVEYEPVAEAVDAPPTITFVGGDGALLEVRDYRATQVSGPVRFCLHEYITEPFQVTSPLGRVSTVQSRATVVAYMPDGDGWAPALAWYYDWTAADGGRMEVTAPPDCPLTGGS